MSERCDYCGAPDHWAGICPSRRIEEAVVTNETPPPRTYTQSELEAELATARRQIEHAIGIPQEELWRKLNDGTGRKLYFQEDVDALLAAHDAKIRREAYLRCAQHITSGDDRVWALKNIAATYRKWAEEADRGEK